MSNRCGLYRPKSTTDPAREGPRPARSGQRTRSRGPLTTAFRPMRPTPVKTFPYTLRTAITEFMPPKANALLIAMFTRRSRAKFGVTSRFFSGIGASVTDGGRHDAASNGVHACDHLNRARRAKTMPMHGFRRRNAELVGMTSEYGPNGLSLRSVVELCAGTVGVDIVHQVSRHARVRQAKPHRVNRPIQRWTQFQNRMDHLWRTLAGVTAAGRPSADITS